MESSTFTSLYDFLHNKMRMAHVYQPTMIKELLQRNGCATVKEIATQLLLQDRSQIEYYEHITKTMVGKVLVKNRGIANKQGNNYSLNGFDELTAKEIRQLVEVCDVKIDEYIESRGSAIWAHRKKTAGYISGTIRYEILKRAKFRCELCGISAESKALEVDHILPRNKGGSDDITNLQALCYSCNAMKRDRDDADFRGTPESYEERETDCIFCEMDASRVILQDELCYVIRDEFPVTDLHTLIIPKRHVADYFSLFQPELNAINRLITGSREALTSADDSITGFNLGSNNGTDAGQTIHHFHMHLIPRRNGDVENPRGGVRGVIPSKQSY
jgi:diadenosine tetraphosphate (Ap4A) HIT family hydrolase